MREDKSRIKGPHPSRVVVFQDPTLFPWRSVWDNVALGLEAQGILKSQRQRVDAALDLVGLSAFRNAYPHQLSGGMAQRVALARALVNDPKILILDEPLGKLNSLTRITMQAEIVSLWQRKGFTTLLVTHDAEEALFLANRVIVLSDRPARVKADILVDRPYPRHRGDPYLADLRKQISACLDWTPHGDGAGHIERQGSRSGRMKPTMSARARAAGQGIRGAGAAPRPRRQFSVPEFRAICRRPDCWP